MIGSFSGVIAAFALNYVYQSYNSYKNKIKYINIIRSEIESCIKVLEYDIVQSLPDDNWMSAVNSGALRLFKVDIELQSLSKNYYRIHDFNEKARVGEFIGYDWARLNREDGHRLPIIRVKQFLQSRESLLRELKELKDVEWLNPASVPVIKADMAGAYWK